MTKKREQNEDKPAAPKFDENEDMAEQPQVEQPQGTTGNIDSMLGVDPPTTSMAHLASPLAAYSPLAPGEMIDERDGLAFRMDIIKASLDDESLSVTADERGLLKQQLAAMRAYLDVLNLRISLL